MNKTVSKFVNSTMALTLAIGFSLAASPSAQAADDCLPGFTLVGETCEKTYSHTEGAKSLTVPAGLGLFQFEVFGAAGGAGGLDGSSCAKSFGGKAGYLFVESENVSGKTIAFYPGSKGSDGASGAKASGGGLGGTSLVSDEFAGGKGGNAGNVGSSGGGGGGGAATVLDIGSDRYVAAGAGAGGGCANSSGGSTAGSTLENYTETTKGGDGLSTLGNPYSDGGGGGGGGGGILGGAGGLLYKSPQSSESAGYGGNAGTNTPAGNAVTISRYQAATTAGKIIVTYFPVLGTKSLAVLTNSPTKSNVIEFKVTLKSNREFTVDDIELSGSATTAMELKSTITSTKPNKAPYEYFFNVTTEDSSERISGTLVAKVFDVSSNPVVIDAVAPQATVSFEQPTLDQPSKAFKVVFNEPVQGLTVEDFSPAIGTAIDCQVTAVTGDGTTFLVSLANCSEGTFGIVLNANAVTDSLGNQGPSLSLNSGLFGKEVILGTKSLAVLTNSPTKSNVIEFKVTLKSNREFTVDDIELSGSATTAMELKSTITSTKPNKAPYEYFFNVTTEDSSERISGTLVAKVFDVSSNPVVIDAVAPQATVSFEQPTLDQPSKAFKVVFNEPVQGLTVEDFSPAIGTAIDCQVTAVTGDGTTFLVSLANCSEGTFGIVLNANAVTDSLGNQGPSLSLNSGLFGKSVIKDTLAPQATIKLQDGTQQTNVHVYDVRFNEDVNGVSKLSFKPSKGTATDCEIGNVVGSGKYFKVSLENCTDGTFGITLLARSAQDSSGNKGPLANVASALEEQSTKATRVSITPGELPETLEPIAVEKIFSTLDTETQDAVKEVGIYAPIPGAPVVNVETDLSNSTANERIQINSAQSVELGSSVKLTIRVSDEIAANSDVVAFLEVGSVWQYLGRASFEGNTAESSEFAVAKAGTYNLRIVIVGKNVATNMSISKVAGFGKGLSRFRSAVTSQETLLSPQLIDLTLQGIEGPNGAPKVVEPEVVEPEVPVVPEPEPTVPGAQTDENAPSQPYDALATPEGVKAVAEAVGTAVVVAGAVAGAVAAAAGGSGGGGSPRGGASGGPTESTQNTDSSEGEITTLDAEVESFTTARVSWGDRIPIFRLKALTFLDSFTHNLTVALAKFSPVISKIVNDGAYLRSIFGSMWLAAPITGVALAITALMQPSIELRPPTWELFLVIAVLGMFDAFSGMLATVIYSIGMISIYGISDLSDVRLMLGVLLLGFGPALIGVAFRAIRKQVETSFAYFWDRLADLAVLTFFISWSVSAMVATLPALAGRTLVVANHTAEFSLFLAIAIGVRILLEELAARGFSKRLDTINPTEVPGTSQLQKVISTALRLFIFIFVTAAFMGNVWQVWVGSIIFILPNILGWFSDRFPNSPLLWKILPQGVPALALTLIVSSLSAGVIGGWLEGNPEYPQYLFMLLPIPVFLIGLLGMFGREGRNGEERPIMKPKWRWVYRVGGIVMLALTMNLAGVLVI
jgi:hypothetical protein